MSFKDEKVLYKLLVLVLALNLRKPKIAIQNIFSLNAAILERLDAGTGMTPLHVACHSNATLLFDIMKLLVAQVPNAVSLVDKATGGIPLHCACSGNSPHDLARLL